MLRLLSCRFMCGIALTVEQRRTIVRIAARATGHRCFTEGRSRRGYVAPAGGAGDQQPPPSPPRLQLDARQMGRPRRACGRELLLLRSADRRGRGAADDLERRLGGAILHALPGGVVGVPVFHRGLRRWLSSTAANAAATSFPLAMVPADRSNSLYARPA